MATTKTWSYAELTAAAERHIDASRRLAADEDDDDGRRYHRTAATGAIELWDTLTRGWQADGDRARLRALVAAIGAK